jgi:hypothetical protein
VWIIGIHNVSVRNWGAALGERAPALLSATGLVAEAIAFSVVVLMAVYTLINRPSVACSTPDRSCRIANNSRGRE